MNSRLILHFVSLDIWQKYHLLILYSFNTEGETRGRFCEKQQLRTQPQQPECYPGLNCPIVLQIMFYI